MGDLIHLEAELRAELVSLKIQRHKLEDKFSKMRVELYDMRAALALIDKRLKEVRSKLENYSGPI